MIESTSEMELPLGTPVVRFYKKHCASIHKKRCWPTNTCTNEVREDVEEHMENNPSISLRHMSQEVGLSVGTCHKIVKKALPFSVQTSCLT